MAYRVEHDLLGEVQVPADALYGAHTQRAVANFPLAQRPVSRHLVHAYGQVKLACARTNHELGRWDEPTCAAIEQACAEMAEGKLDEHVIVDALQGGAGTSTNMNVNEVLAHRAMQILNPAPLPQVGERLGEGDESAGAPGAGGLPSPQPSPSKGTGVTLHPLDDINLHQSTNDTYPTALKVAAIAQLRQLERDITALVDAFQAKEKALGDVVKVARTQLQDAVLSTVGRQMGAYAEAFARDRWRVYKCEERLRVVNLGGTAIGTGLGAPRQFIFRAIEHLRDITGFGLARAENLLEATQNTDAFVEVSGILRAFASNLLKVSNDLRLMSSGPDAGFGEITLPPRQAGSSIMPGKVNPVIPEGVAQCAIAAMAHDQALTQACTAGNLELNQFMPLVADSLLTMLDLLRNACTTFTKHCVVGIEADARKCAAHVAGATATVTALVDALGYETAQRIAETANREGCSIKDAALELTDLTAQQFDQLTSPEAVTRLGSTGGPR
jgi:aspartate ammonia-lyase